MAGEVRETLSRIQEKRDVPREIMEIIAGKLNENPVSNSGKMVMFHVKQWR